MKRKLRTALRLCLCLCLAAALSACGGGDASDTAAPETPEEGNSGGSYGDYGWDGGTAAEEAGVSQTGTKMIYTADITLETRDFDAAAEGLTELVQDLGGYFESRSLYQGGALRSLSCVIRVPAENFTRLLDEAGSAAHVTDRREYSDDVSETYYDSEARLATQRTKLARLQELLAQAQSVEDMISIESAISDAELEIEYLTGELRHYDSLAAYSTVDLSLEEVYRLSSDQESGESFAGRLGAAFVSGWNGFLTAAEELAVLLARLWPVLLLALAAVLIALAASSARRRRKGAPPAASAEPAVPAVPGEPGEEKSGDGTVDIPWKKGYDKRTKQ